MPKKDNGPKQPYVDPRDADLPPEKRAAWEIWRKVWHPFRSVLAFVAALSIVAWGVMNAVTFVHRSYIQPIDSTDRMPITVTIESGSSLSSISKTLAEAGVIRSATVFKYYVDFTDRSPKLKAGEYQFCKAMNMEEIIDSLIAGDGKAKIMKLVLTEGMTLEAFADKLVNLDVLDKKSELLDLCKTGEDFVDGRPFIRDLIDDEENAARRYMLEGYLFPDTYEFYVDATAEDIVVKMVNQMSIVFSDEYAQRCEELGMTMDEILTLASIIEKEAVTEDFAKVSAVFHGRLRRGMKLESCATVQYAIGINRLALTAADIAVDSPYNTYLHEGLPIGPICAPSKAAIEAALYPDETYLQEGYLFFCLTDPATTQLAFSKTAQEHAQLSEQYRELWKASDEERGVAAVDPRANN